MFDDVLKSQQEQVGTNEVQQPTGTNVSQESKVDTKPVESSKEYNLRVLRERAERAEQRMAEMERALNSQREQPKNNAVIESDEEIDLDDESYVEGKQLKKYLVSLKKELKQTKQELLSNSQRSAETAAELRLKAQYPDFEKVVCEDNIKNLAAIHPEDYQSMLHNPDLYARAKTAYNMIKRYGLSTDYVEADQKIEENKNKPRSSASIAPQAAETPLARVGDYDRRILTEDRKEQLRRQVEESKKYR